MGAIITGIGHFFPEKKLTNADLEKMVETTDEWITTRTGIKERRILDDGIGVSFMAVEAARKILDEKNMSADEIDLIIVATVTPDMPIPSCAALVQHELGANKCWGFDLNGGCSGFLYALATGAQFIRTGAHQKVMVIGADKMSAIIDYEDRATCIIFGDGAGAVLLEPSEDEDLGIRDYILRLDGIGHHHLCMKGGGSLYPASHETVDKKMHYVFQDGKAVFKQAINGMVDISRKVLEKNSLKIEDIALLVPHQANLRIIDSVSNRLGIDPEKVVINIQKYGNTTAATIPVALNEAYRDQRVKKGDWVLLSAFGAGFAWGSLLLKWSLE